jgi:hypothetical protein
LRRTNTKGLPSVASPTITSFSPDTGIATDGITDANVLTLDGSAVANSLVSIYDGVNLIGTATANSVGFWTFTTGVLVDGVHDFTATDTQAGNTSAISNVEAVTIDPPSPVITAINETGIDQEAFSGNAEANSTITVYDGSVKLGTTVANNSGSWSFTSGILPTGSQTFTATATDGAGYISAASQPVAQTVEAHTAASTTSAIPVPAEAAAVNYNQLVFDDEFNSLSTIDMTNSHAAGYNWYLQYWFSTDATNPNNVSISNGVLELGGGTGAASLVSAFANSSGGYTGTVFGNGAYMESSIQFNPSGGSNAMCWPAFWGLSIQHVVDPGADGVSQFAGQAAGYTHYAEADIMEYMSDTSGYLGTIHDWSGTYSVDGWQFNIQNNGNNYIDVGSVNWNVFHTYGLLWVPQSGNTPGHATWYFDGQAESTIYWLGPATSTSLPGISSGSFTPSTSADAASTYSILDDQQLALSLSTDSSWPMYVDWVRVWQSGSAPVTLAAPDIVSYSPDTGVIGDGITNASTITINGTAAASTTELVYDGTTWLGSATANAGGAWTFTTDILADGAHNLTAISTDAQGDTSAASAALTVTVDTTPPTVTAALAQDTGASSTDHITSNDILTGSGDPNAVVQFTIDGKAVSSPATANASGVWTFIPTGLADGTHTVVASETDAAGNTGTASLTFTLDTTPPTVAISNETYTSGKATLTGVASEAGDAIAVYDGTTLLGTTTSGTGGAWSFTTGAAPNAGHTYTVTATDVAGNVGQGSNDAILATNNGAALTGTGNDIIVGTGNNTTFTGAGGGNVMTAGGSGDNFIFKAVTDSTPANHDTIVNFNHINDLIEFSGISGINATNGVPTFQGQLAGAGALSLNAHSVAFIETGGNTDVLVNTTNSAETVTAQDMHAANMLITLTGTHLGLTSSDFHLV